ncbi:putative protein [Methanobacterium congolense]|uniref:Inner membrane protein n=2 Tax=Methanobacterium congolense TaxID=118062 RepID=A0A1D3L1I5_9EURY|nr:putative protein [Methanobacterium congolense]
MMKYSAGLISKSFWYLESKKTARYMLDGLTREEIRDLAIKDNIYQVESEYRAKNLANAIYTRLNSLPEIILKDVVDSDVATSKVLVLISIMKTDRLFFEFMHEVFRNNIILGDLTIKDRDLNLFFQEKKVQSEIVDKWVDKTIKKLKSRYLTVLGYAGVIRTNTDKREIIVPFIDYKIKQKLIDNNMAPYLYAITGEK